MRGLLTILAIITVLGAIVVLVSMKPPAGDTLALEPAVITVKGEPVEPEIIIVEAPRITNAICVLQPTAGHTASGRVTFHEHNGLVTLRATIHGLAPNSSHGFHIHDLGDISAADGTSAGGHYNPESHKHALPGNGERHAGDFGNVVADDNGSATFVGEFETISINGVNNPILGRAMILHDKQDDGGQPTGNAGARIAMGVIGVAAAPKVEPEPVQDIEEDVLEDSEPEEASDSPSTAPEAPL